MVSKIAFLVLIWKETMSLYSCTFKKLLEQALNVLWLSISIYPVHAHAIWERNVVFVIVLGKINRYIYYDLIYFQSNFCFNFPYALLFYGFF